MVSDMDKKSKERPPVYKGLHEECGVFGIYDFDGGDVASTIYCSRFSTGDRRAAGLRSARQAVLREE